MPKKSAQKQSAAKPQVQAQAEQQPVSSLASAEQQSLATELFSGQPSPDTVVLESVAVKADGLATSLQMATKISVDAQVGDAPSIAPSQTAVSEPISSIIKAPEESVQKDTMPSEVAQAALPVLGAMPKTKPITRLDITFRKDISYAQYVMLYLILAAAYDYETESFKFSQQVHQEKVGAVYQFITQASQLADMPFDVFLAKLKELKQKLELQISDICVSYNVRIGGFAQFSEQVTKAIELVQVGVAEDKELFGFAARKLNEIQNDPLFILIDGLYRQYVLMHKLKQGNESIWYLAAQGIAGDNGAKFEEKKNAVLAMLQGMISLWPRLRPEEYAAELEAKLRALIQRNDEIDMEKSTLAQSAMHKVAGLVGGVTDVATSVASLAGKMQGVLFGPRSRFRQPVAGAVAEAAPASADLIEILKQAESEQVRHYFSLRDIVFALRELTQKLLATRPVAASAAPR